MKAIISITSGPRESNFELLRIFAMFLVLGVHADFFSNGAPSAEDFVNNPTNAWVRTFFQSATIVCVNVFVLISGWFGIKPKLKGLLNFFFQCIFFYLSIYIFELIYRDIPFSIIDLRRCFFFAPDSGWFVVAYTGLYLLSPILNSFVKNNSKTTFRKVLIAFLLFQTYGWLGGGIGFLAGGYSTFSFIGLYLMARYLNIYNPINCKMGGVIYIISILLMTGLFGIVTLTNIQINVYAYDNPLVILGAIGLLLRGSVLKLKYNKFINWISSSVLAVYLFHMSPFTGYYYGYIFKRIYNTFSGIECIGIMFLAMTSIFIIAILLDQPRKFLWGRISYIIFQSSNLPNSINSSLVQKDNAIT